MTTRKSFYITTAISYPNGAPHIGHAYELIAADAIARFKRLDGKDVFFLTGTDEHGQKMLQTAAARRDSPRATSPIATPRASARWPTALDASNDDFIRTTEPRHYEACQEIWKRMEANGDIYLGEVFRLVFRARRGLFRRGRDHRRRGRQCAGPSGTPWNGWRRRATSSASPPIRTGCSRSTRRTRISSARKAAATRS